MVLHLDSDDSEIRKTNTGRRLALAAALALLDGVDPDDRDSVPWDGLLTERPLKYQMKVGYITRQFVSLSIINK